MNSEDHVIVNKIVDIISLKWSACEIFKCNGIKVDEDLCSISAEHGKCNEANPMKSPFTQNCNAISVKIFSKIEGIMTVVAVQTTSTTRTTKNNNNIQWCRASNFRLRNDICADKNVLCVCCVLSHSVILVGIIVC